MQLAPVKLPLPLRGVNNDQECFSLIFPTWKNWVHYDLPSTALWESHADNFALDLYAHPHEIITDILLVRTVDDYLLISVNFYSATAQVSFYYTLTFVSHEASRWKGVTPGERIDKAVSIGNCIILSSAQGCILPVYSYSGESLKLILENHNPSVRGAFQK